MHHRVKEKETGNRKTDVSNQKSEQKVNHEPRLPEKIFEVRKSILTELYEDNIHTRAIINFIMGFSIFNMVTLILKDYVYYGRLSSAFILIFNQFRNLHVTFLIWIVLNLLIFICYYVYLFWGKLRRKVPNTWFWDRIWLTVFIGYITIMFYVTTILVIYLEMQFATKLLILSESTRLLMKLYSFVRSNVPRVTTFRSPNDCVHIPTFGKYLYFLYAPTLIYRDEYPRTGHIRWSFVFYRVLEVFGIIVSLAFLAENIANMIFMDTCKQPITVPQFLVLILQGSLISTVILLLLWWLVFHSVQNAVGEMLRFGDRLFHSDWWNCTEMPDFYKKWNMVVGDWLYTYVHKDIIESFNPRNKLIPKAATIMLSALMHEYIITVSIGFFCPIVTAVMLVSVYFSTIKVANKGFNRLLIITLYPLGPGTIGTFGFVEYYSRQNIPDINTLSVFWSNNCVTFK
ncbi:sterol O-acyltransferase 1-like isoform X2 [Diabrotica undecimpunctata]